MTTAMTTSSGVMQALRRTRTSNNLYSLRFCTRVGEDEQKPTVQPLTAQPITNNDQTTADKEEEELSRALEIRSQRYTAALKTLAPVVIGMYLCDYPTVCRWLAPGLFHQSWIKEDSTGVGAWLKNKGPQRVVENGKQAWDNWNLGAWLKNKGPQRAVENGKQAWDNWNLGAWLKNKGPQRAVENGKQAWDDWNLGAWLKNKGPQRVVENGKQAWDNWNLDARKMVLGEIMEGALKKAFEESGLKDLADEFKVPYGATKKQAFKD